MRMRVLVVDADPDARAALCALLRTIGHEPQPAGQLRALAGPGLQPAAAVLAAEWTRAQHTADLRAFSQTAALPILLLIDVNEENTLASMADLPVFAVLPQPTPPGLIPGTDGGDPGTLSWNNTIRPQAREHPPCPRFQRFQRPVGG